MKSPTFMGEMVIRISDFIGLSGTPEPNWHVETSGLFQAYFDTSRPLLTQSPMADLEITDDRSMPALAPGLFALQIVRHVSEIGCRLLPLPTNVKREKEKSTK